VGVVHVVLFRFAEALSSEDDAALTEMVAAFPKVMRGMKTCRFGTDLTGARTFGFHYLLDSEFEDLSALEAYRVHPLHVEFVEWIGARGCEVLAFDYELTDKTDFTDRT
jgi:hypothetical protein